MARVHCHFCGAVNSVTHSPNDIEGYFLTEEDFDKVELTADGFGTLPALKQEFQKKGRYGFLCPNCKRVNLYGPFRKRKP